MTENTLMINGITRIYVEENETYLYYTEEMLKSNVLIVESPEYDNQDNIKSNISIKHFNDLNAYHLSLYWGDNLEPIQSFRIVKDIVDLFNTNTLQDFLVIIKELSTSSMTALDQTKPKNYSDIIEWIKSSFEYLPQ